MNEQEDVPVAEACATDTPNETPSDTAADAAINPDALRQHRIAAKTAQALTAPDLTVGNIGALGAGLMRAAQLLERRINEELAKCIATEAPLTTVLPLVDTLLRVERQIERYVQLEMRITHRQQAAVGQNSIGPLEQLRAMRLSSGHQAKF